MSFVDLKFYPAFFLLLLAVVLIQRIFRGRPASNTCSKALLLVFSYLVILLYDWRFCLCITAVILIVWQAEEDPDGRDCGRPLPDARGIQIL